MKSTLRKLALVAIAVAAPFVATPVMAEKYILVSHAPDSDTWWNTIKNGIALAGEQVGVDVEYRNPPTGDIADMARLIDQAAASSPDGIITTLADFDVLSGPISAAVDQEYDAGLAAGIRAKGEGVTKFLCVNHAIQQPTVGERCRGYADGLGIDLGDAMMDSGTDPSEIKNKVLAYLSANTDVDGILTLGPVSADPTLAALEENGMAGDIHFGTFDLGEEIVKGIKSDVIAWGIDSTY